MRILPTKQPCQVIADNKIRYSEQNICKLLATVKENLSDLIQRRLKELKIKKAELARRTGLSRTYITDLANGTGNTQSGQYNLSPDSVTKLSKALEVTEAEILEAMNYLSESQPKLPDGLEMMDFDGLDPNDIEEIAAFIRFKKQHKFKTADKEGYKM